MNDLNQDIVCHALGDRCLGCPHYYYPKTGECIYKEEPMTEQQERYFRRGKHIYLTLNGEENVADRPPFAACFGEHAAQKTLEALNNTDSRELEERIEKRLETTLYGWSGAENTKMRDSNLEEAELLKACLAFIRGEKK